MQKFNDERLTTLAKTLYYNRGKEPNDVVRKAFTGETLGRALTNEERNALVEFIEENALSNRLMSMASMKREILTAIGRTDVLQRSSNVLNAAEVRAVYEWFVSKGFKNGTKS